MKRKQMISFLLASSISISPLSIMAEPITNDMPSLIKNEGDLETTTSPAIEIVSEDTVTEDRPTVLPLLPEDYEEADKPVTLPMTPDDYEEETNRPVTLPMTPQDYKEMESQKGVYLVDSQGYTVVEYNDKNDSLEEIIQRLGIPFPEKLKVITRGNGEIDWSDSWYLKENGVDVDLTEINFWKNEIMGSAFENSPTLRSIKLPNTVTRIDDYAFRNCRNLSGELILPKGIDTIGKQVFANTNISGNLVIPDSITEIGEGAFANCPNLNGYLVLPARKSMSMEMPAIQGNNFHTIINYSTRNEGNQLAPSDICSNQTYYGFSSNETFKQTVLENGGKWVELADDRLWEDIYIRYDSRYNSLQQAIEANIPYVETYQIRDWVQKNIIIETADGKKLTPTDFEYLNQSSYLMSLDLTLADCENREIPQNAFNHNVRLIHCKLPRNIDVIQSNAFFNCEEMIGLIDIPQTVISIKSFAFTDCGELTGNLNLPKGLVEIGDSAFSGCDGLTGEIILPKGLKTIGFSAFQHCTGFTGDLFLPDSLTQINNFAFGGCTGLNGTLTLPSKKILFSSDAFNYTQFETIRNYSAQPLRNVISFNEVDTQNFYGFSDNILQKEEIDLSQVNWVELSEPSQWETLEIIYDNRYNSLQEAIEDQVPLIEKYDVRDWVQKNVVIVTKDDKTLNEMDFKTLNESSYLMCLDLSQADCENNAIPEKAFEENKILIYLTLPNNITSIHDFSFAYMSEWIGNLTLPSSLTSIGRYAFSGNEGLKTLILPDRLESIGDYAFLNLLGLKKIVNNYEGNQLLGESSFDINSQEGIAYGYRENERFKTEIEKESFTWKEIGLRATPLHQEIKEGDTVDIEDLYEAYFDGEPLTGIATTQTDLSRLEVGLNEIEITLNHEGMLKTIIVEVTVLPNELSLEIESVPQVITHGDVLDLEDLFVLRYNGEEVVPDRMIQTTDYPLEALPIGNFQVGITVTYKDIEKSVVTDVTVNVDEKNFIVEPLHQTIAHTNPITVEQLYQATYRTEPVTNVGFTDVNLSQLDIGKHDIPITVRHLGMEKNIIAEVRVLRNFDLYEVLPVSSLTIKQGESIDLNDLFTATYNKEPIEADQVRQVSNLDLTDLPIGEHEIEIEVTYKELKKNVKIKVTVVGDENLFVVNPLFKEFIDGDTIVLKDLYESFYQDVPVEAAATTSVDLSDLPLGKTEIPLNVSYKGMTKKIIVEITIKPNPEQLKGQGVSQSIQHGESIREEDLYLLTYKEMPVVADQVIQTTDFNLNRLPIGSHKIGLNLDYKGSLVPVVAEVEVLASEILFDVRPISQTITEGEPISLDDLYQATYDASIVRATSESEVDLMQLGVGEHEIPINVSYLGLEKQIVATLIVQPNSESFTLESQSQTIQHKEGVTLKDLFIARYKEELLEYDALTDVRQVTGYDLENLPVGTHEIEIEVQYENVTKRIVSRVIVQPLLSEWEVLPQNISIIHGQSLTVDQLYTATYDTKPIETQAEANKDLSDLEVGTHNIEVTVHYFNLEKTITSQVIVKPNAAYLEVEGVEKSFLDGEEIDLNDLYTATYNHETVIADEVELISPTNIKDLEVGLNEVTLKVFYKGLFQEITSQITLLSNEDAFIVSPQHQTITDGDLLTVEDLYSATYKGQKITGIGKINENLNELPLGENRIQVTIEYLGMERLVEVKVLKNPNPNYFEIIGKPQTIEHGDILNLDDLCQATYKKEPIQLDKIVQTSNFDLTQLEVGSILIELEATYKEMVKSVEVPVKILAKESDFIVTPLHPTIIDGDNITVEDLYDATYKGEPVENIGQISVDLSDLEFGENQVTVTVEHLGMREEILVIITKNPNIEYFIAEPKTLNIIHGESVRLEDLFEAFYKGEPIVLDEIKQLTSLDLNNLEVGENVVEIQLMYKGLLKEITSIVYVHANTDEFTVNSITKNITHGTSVDIEDLYTATYKGEPVTNIGHTEVDLTRLEVGTHQIPITVTYLDMTKEVTATVNVSYNPEYFEVTTQPQTITHGQSLTVDELYTATYDQEPIQAQAKANKDLTNLPVGTHEVEITVIYEGMTKKVNTMVTVKPDTDSFDVKPVTKSIVHGTALTIEDLYTATYKGEPVTNIGHTEVDLTRLDVGTHTIPITVTHLGMEKQIEATINVSYNPDFFVVTGKPQTITHGQSLTVDQLYAATYDNKPIQAQAEANKDLTSLSVGTHEVEVTVNYQSMTKKETVSVTVNPDQESFTIDPLTKSIVHGKSVSVEDLYVANYKGEKVTDIGHTDINLTRLEVGTHHIPITVSYLGMTKEVTATVNVSYNPDFFVVTGKPQTITHSQSLTVDQLYSATYDNNPIVTESQANKDLTNLPVGTHEVEVTVNYEGMIKQETVSVIVNGDQSSFIVNTVNKDIVHGTALTIEDLYAATYKGQPVTHIGKTEVDLSRLDVGTHTIPITVTHLDMEREIEATVNVSYNPEYFEVTTKPQTVTYGDSLTLDQLYSATYDGKTIVVEAQSNKDLTKLPVGENQIEITVTYEGMTKIVKTIVQVIVDEESLVITPTNPTITDGDNITVEDLYDATYKGEQVENIGKVDIDLSNLELGENKVTVTVDFEGVKQEIEVTITVNPNPNFFKAHGTTKTIMQGQSVHLEDLYQVTYKEKPIVPEKVNQTTNFDLTKLPVGKHEVDIELQWKGLTQNVVSEVTVKRKPIVDTSDDNKHNPIPATPLEPSQTIVPMEKLEPAIIHKPLIPLNPSIQMPVVDEVEKPQEEILPILPSQEPVEDPKVNEKPDSITKHESTINNNVQKNPISSNSVQALNNQEWVKIEPSLPIQTLEDTQFEQKEDVEVPQTPISEEVIVNEDSEQTSNSFYEQVKKLFPNMSYETFILLSSSTAFVVIALILVIVVYINKKRKEKK